MENKEQLPDSEKLTFSKSKIFIYVLAILIFAFVIYYFAEIKGDIKLFIKVHPAWLAVALAAQLGTYFFNSVIGRGLLRTFSPKSSIPLKQLFQANIVTLFINQTIPSVNVSGNLYFFNFLKKRGVPEPAAFSLLILELLTFYAAVICIILVLLFSCIFWKAMPSYFIFFFLGGIIAYTLFALLIGLLGRGKTVASLLKKLSRIRLLKKSIQKYKTIPFAQIKNPWQIFTRHTPIVISTMFFHACIFGCDALTLFALFQGLGIAVSFLAVFAGYVLTKIISLLPFLPGALLLYEGSMTYFYVHLGIPVAVAAMVTLLYRALSFWLPIPVGFFLYRKLERDAETK